MVTRDPASSPQSRPEGSPDAQLYDNRTNTCSNSVLLCASPKSPHERDWQSCQWLSVTFLPVRSLTPTRRETVSAEKNPNDTREQELWERISTSEGAERAEVLDELSHIAYHRSSYTECLNLIESSLEIYYKLGGAENYLSEMTHLYEGKPTA